MEYVKFKSDPWMSRGHNFISITIQMMQIVISAINVSLLYIGVLGDILKVLFEINFIVLTEIIF